MGANWSAPIRSFFNRDKVKEEVQQGVEVVVNAAEKGLQEIDEATHGAVSSIADELSKAGVDLGQFKNSMMEKLEHDVEAITDDVQTLENEVLTIGKKSIDEVQNVQTQTSVVEGKPEEPAKAIFVSAEKVASDVGKKVESTVETVASLAADMIHFPGSQAVVKETPVKKESAEQTASSGVQKVEQAASTTEKKVGEGLFGFGGKIVGGISDALESVAGQTHHIKEKTPVKDDVPKAVSDENKGVSSRLTPDKEVKSSDIPSGVKQGEELAPTEVEKDTQSLSSQPSDTSVSESEAESKKEKKEFGFSSGLRFLRDTAVASKDIVLETLTFNRSHGEEDSGKKSPPQFQSTQKPISSPTSAEEKPVSDIPAKEISDKESDNSEKKEVEMGDEKEKKEASPIKEVSAFLNQEISESTKDNEAKGEEVRKEVTEPSSNSSNKVAETHSLFDSFTNISSTIANTIHNIETDIETTGKNILTGVGTKVKEAGDFIAGTEEDQDLPMDDKELKTEAVTSLLDKSFIN